jgi:hypothetical protein
MQGDRRPVPVRLAGSVHWGFFFRAGGLVKIATLCGRVLACPRAAIATPGQVRCEKCRRNHPSGGANDDRENRTD